MASDFSYSEITDGDYEMAQNWSLAHGNLIIESELLPATGFVVCRDQEPVLMFWMYFDNSCPVTIIDWVISRPGATAAEVRAAVRYATNVPALRAMVFHGARRALARTPAAFVRGMRMVERGWRIYDKELCSLVYELKEEEVSASYG